MIAKDNRVITAPANTGHDDVGLMAAAVTDVRNWFRTDEAFAVYNDTR